MLYKQFTGLLTLGMAAAAPSKMPRQDAARKLLIGTPAQVITADFSGSQFTVTSKYHQQGSAPSWLQYKAPNLVYAVNENGADLNLLALDDSSANPTLQASAQGASGVVSLALNRDQTRLVGASYGEGSFDVWDAENLLLLKNVAIEGTPGPGQEGHRAHQALLDPSGRYFVIPNLGGDSLLVVDSQDDKFEVVNTIDVGSGSGPRHGGFVSGGEGQEATHYVVATELSNELVLYSLQYGAGTIEFTEAQRTSTYGPGFPAADPSTAAAGELAVSNDGAHVYVSNRLSGNATDSIAHFTLNGGALSFADTVSSGGLLPRMFSLSKDAEQGLVFVANQGGDNGVAAFKRDAATGSLAPEPVASLPLADLVAPEFVGQENVGPQFIQEI